VNREAQSVVLFLVGGAILRISVTDIYLRYVKEGLRPFLIASGVVLVAIAGATLFREVFSRQPTAVGPTGEAPVRGDALGVDGTHHDEDGHGHGHGHGGPRVAWLLVAPVLAIFLISPPPLGSYSATRGATSITEESNFAPLPAGDPVRVKVLDYATRAVWDEGASMSGRRVLLVGFVTPRANGGVYLARIVMSCCAADGLPIKIVLRGEVPAGLQPDTWVEVVGRYDPKTEEDPANGEVVPSLHVESLRVVPAPREPYES